MTDNTPPDETTLLRLKPVRSEFWRAIPVDVRLRRALKYLLRQCGFRAELVAEKSATEEKGARE